MSVIRLLANDNYFVVNRDLAKVAGMDAALLMGELCAQANKFDEEWFYISQEKLEENTTMSPYRQREALKTLKGMGLIGIERRGVPAKNYYKINEEELLQFFNIKMSKFLTSGSEEISQLNLNNNNEYNKNICAPVKKPAKVNSKMPTLDEVKEYCTKKNNGVDPVKFYEYYNADENHPWTDAKGNPVVGWKQKMNGIWVGKTWWKDLPGTKNETSSEEFEYEDLPKSFRKSYERIGVKWDTSLPRICKAVSDLQHWYKDSRTNDDFNTRNMGTTWDGLRFSAESFWDSFLEYIHGVLGDRPPQAGHFAVDGNMLNSWAREMGVSL